MATYFHGSSEFQAASAAAPDGMQTLYLMNPSYVPYPDTHQPVAATTNMFFLNPAGNALNNSSLPHAPPPNYQQHLLALPLPTTPTASIGPANSDETHRPSSLHGMVSGVHHYNLWGSSTVDHQNSPRSTYPPQVVSAAATADNSGGPHDVASQLGLRRPVVVSPRQGLSLSLSSQQQVAYRSNNVETDIQGQPPQVPTLSPAADDMRISGNSPSSVSVVSNGIPGVQSVVLGSKYLRAAQELLDEFVNVGKAIKTDVSEGTKRKIKVNKESVMADAATGEGSSAAENGAQPGAELTTAQRQELQMKKAKLVSMLDEVEQRYRQYHHQMQIVVSSLEQAAGFGAAKSYTSLALRTISKQFRCLKDAISGQIKATSKSLGEEDCLGVKFEGSSRLRYVDYQLRQQRALQQLGMIQHNAWRPQRGLPERAVSVLRAWLFEHFLHPYPKDSDKHMLAKQTGLTRSQVSNWFINARVRLWKPMVEEMYWEESKEQKKNNGGDENARANKSEQKESGSSSSSGQQESVSLKMDHHQVIKSQSKTDKSIDQMINSTSPTEFSNSTISMGGSSLLQQTAAAFNLIGSSDLDGAASQTQRSSKKPRNIINDHQLQINSPSSILSMDMEMKQGAETTREINLKLMGDDERLFKDSFPYLPGTTYNSTTMGEIGRFDPDQQQQLQPSFHGNSVSLTLGLPYCDNLPLSGNQRNFLPNHGIQLGRRLGLRTSESDLGGINTNHHQRQQQQASHSSAGGYDIDSIEMQNRKRFDEQLLPDFVG